MKKSGRIYYILAGISLLLGVLMLFVVTSVRFTGFLFGGAAAVLAILGVLTQWKEKRRWVLWTRRGFLALLAAGFLFFAVMEIQVISWARTDNETPAAAVIVLGAGVNGTEPSLSLRTRLDAALAYIQDRPDIPVVVSGSQGRGEEISEARCMYDWLTAHGVDGRRIILEEQANNTKENIQYSLALLAERGIDTTDNLAVVSSDYHLCRASMYLSGEYGAGGGAYAGAVSAADHQLLYP